MKVLVLWFMMVSLAHAASVTLTWDFNPAEDNITSYKVVYGLYSGNTRTFNAKGSVSVPGTVNVATIPMNGTEKYYFRASALSGVQESLYSNYVYMQFIRTPAALKFQNIQVR